MLRGERLCVMSSYLLLGEILWKWHVFAKLSITPMRFCRAGVPDARSRGEKRELRGSPTGAPSEGSIAPVEPCRDLMAPGRRGGHRRDLLVRTALPHFRALQTALRTLLEASACNFLPTIAQTGGKAVYRQVDPGDDILIRVAGAIALQQLDLHVIERIEIGEAVADRARQ